jgi:hypothetical protein
LPVPQFSDGAFAAVKNLESMNVFNAVSLTVVADVVIVLSGNDYAKTKRRFTPGLMVGWPSTESQPR